MLKQIWFFILHLRPHYQILILSGGFLLGGLLADTMNHQQFWFQFLNVHILLFGGATAYNSYWDKDEGPVGGLKNPPVMSSWMHPASLLFQFAGLYVAWQMGIHYALIYFVSFILFWLYSTPLARWKGHPLLSIFVIAVSTGTNSVLLGCLAAGGQLSANVIVAAAGASFIL
ncbi:MAG: UbiA family prenyltransferase, partial [Balneolaceae bacterium]